MSAISAHALADGLAQAHWTHLDLWLAAIAVGGALTATDIVDLTTGHRDATAIEHDILAVALNDHFVALNQDHPVPYWHELPT